MKKTYIQPNALTIALQPQNIMDFSNGGGYNPNNANYSQWRNFGDTEEEEN